MGLPATKAAQELLHCLGDLWWRLDNLYYILDEHGHRVRFRLRPIQKLFLQLMWFRNVILKARQLGFTTAIDIYILDRCLFNENIKAGIIAHTERDVIEIFSEKIKYAYDNLPPDVSAMVSAKKDAANHLKFSNGSSVRVAVSMRSGTLQILHISEYGKLWAQFPKKAKEVKTGSLPTVHQNGIVIIESTAEGMGGHYHELCMEAQRLELAGAELTRLDYKFHFHPWWSDPKYSTEPPEDFEFSAKHRTYFKDLAARIGQELTPAQQYWYVVMERTMQGEMKQEFPSTPDEAFLFSGRKAFDADALNRADAASYDPVWRGEISTVNGQLREHPEGELVIWEYPDPGEQYAIGCDVAEGIEVGEENKDLDYSSADVLDGFGRQVAQWHGRIGTDLYAQALNQLGLLYNTAYLGVERNNHGHAVLNKLLDLHYPNLHVEIKLDDKSQKETRKVGWLTTSASKPFIIGNLSNLLRDDSAGVRSKESMSELHTYVVDGKGRFGAAVNCHDDRVMSLAIAQEMARVMPRNFVGNDRPVSRPDRDWRAA